MHKSGGADSSLWGVKYHPKAEKEIHQLTLPIRERVRHAIEFLQKEHLAGKPLFGRLQGYRSYRVGEYRIVYMLEEPAKMLFILHVGPRGGAYPRARRRST
jgi:addiction module RelE/StbE family toxin